MHQFSLEFKLSNVAPKIRFHGSEASVHRLPEGLQGPAREQNHVNMLPRTTTTNNSQPAAPAARSACLCVTSEAPIWWKSVLKVASWNQIFMNGSISSSSLRMKKKKQTNIRFVLKVNVQTYFGWKCWQMLCQSETFTAAERSSTVAAAPPAGRFNQDPPSLPVRHFKVKLTSGDIPSCSSPFCDQTKLCRRHTKTTKKEKNIPWE